MEMSINKILIYIIVLIFLIAIKFIIIGISALNNVKKKNMICNSITEGEVVDIVKLTNYNDLLAPGILYPVFEYSVEGKKYVKKSNFGTITQKYIKGNKVQIHYNSDNCDQFYVEGENMQRNLGIFYIVMGIIAFIVDIIVLGVNIKQ